jgi:hypothetical protein
VLLRLNLFEGEQEEIHVAAHLNEFGVQVQGAAEPSPLRLLLILVSLLSCCSLGERAYGLEKVRNVGVTEFRRKVESCSPFLSYHDVTSVRI